MFDYFNVKLEFKNKTYFVYFSENILSTKQIFEKLFFILYITYMSDKKFSEDLNKLLFKLKRTKITKPKRYIPSTIKKSQNDIEEIIKSIEKL